MRRHWPLGRGSPVVAALTLSLTAMAWMMPVMVVMRSWTDHYVETGELSRELAALARGWIVVAFVTLGMAGAVLLTFSAGLIQIMLPTPMLQADILRRLSPVRNWHLRMLPFAAGAAAALFAGEGHGISGRIAAAFFFGMMLRVLLPIVMALGILLRRLLVPFGHWIAAGSVVAALAGVAARRSVPGAHCVFVELSPRWLYLVAGVLLIPLASVARRLFVDAALARVSRAELLDLAFPLEAVRRSARRRTLVELFGGGPRRRRCAFLLQEASGYYRPRDLLIGTALGAGAFCAVLLGTAGYGGSAAQMLAALATTLTLLGFGVFRQLSFHGTPENFKPYSTYAPPVGLVEHYLTLLAFASAALLASGTAAAILGLLIWPAAPEASALPGLLAAVRSGRGLHATFAVNMAQGWLLLAAVLAMPSCACLAIRMKRRAAPQVLCGFLVIAVVALAGAFVIAAIGFLGDAEDAGVQGPLAIDILPSALRVVYGAADAMADPFEHYSGYESVVAHLPSAGPSAAAAWALPALLLVGAWCWLLGPGRSQAHHGYRSSMSELAKQARAMQRARKAGSRLLAASRRA